MRKNTEIMRVKKQTNELDLVERTWSDRNSER